MSKSENITVDDFKKLPFEISPTLMFKIETGITNKINDLKELYVRSLIESVEPTKFENLLVKIEQEEDRLKKFNKIVGHLK